MEWSRRFGRCGGSVSTLVLCFLIFASAVSALASADTTGTGVDGANLLVRQPREATRSVIAVLGGKADGADNDNEIWLFDPEKTTDPWQDAAVELDETRESPVAGSLGKGQLVVAGGSSNNDVSTSFLVIQDVFGPNSVSEGQNMPRTVQRAGYATLDGVLYVAGGTSSSNFGSNSVSNDLYRFDGETWTHLADMQTARADLALVADPTAKKLYAIGGTAKGESPLSSVESLLLRPDSKWEESPALPDRRYAHAAAFFKGTIYVAGGFMEDRGQPISSVYKLADKGWSPSPPMKSSRAHFGLVVYGSYMYAIGGTTVRWQWRGQFIIIPTSSVERFDGCAWSSFESMPEPRSHFAVALVLGDTAPPAEDTSSSTSLFVLGIKQSQGSSIGHQQGLTVLQYDANELVSTTSDPSLTDDPFTAAIFNGRLYVMGGDAGSSHGVSNVKSFDGSNWSTEPAPPEPVAHAAAAVFDGKLWLAGGIAPPNRNQATNAVRVFDGQSWSEAENLKLEVARAKFALVEYDGKLYAIGGASRIAGNGGALKSVEVYTTQLWSFRKTWEIDSQLRTSRIQPAAAVAWCRLYVAGGYDSDGSLLDSVEFFDGTRWTYAPNMQLARATALAFFDGALWAMGGEGQSDDDRDPSTSVERLASSENDEEWEYDDSHFLPLQLDSPVALTGTLLNNQIGKTTPSTSTAAATTTSDDAPNDASLWLACPLTKQLYRYTETGFVKQGELSDDLSFSASAVVQNTLYLLSSEGMLLWVDGASYQKTTEPQPQRPGSTVAGCRGMVWVLGGQLRNQFSNLVNIYDPSAKLWHSGPPMPTARAGLSATAFGGQLYAIGGYAGSSALAVVEVFDGWSWSPAPSLLTARFNHASAVFDGKLYVIGGRSQDLQNAVATVEVFDGTSWTSSIALEVPLSIAAATVFNSQLFVAGDAVSNSGAYDTLVYTFDGKDWKSVYSLDIRCGTPALATLSDSERLAASTIGPVFGLSPRLLVVGGYAGDWPSDVMWLFDGSRWSPSQSPEQQRHSHTLTVFQDKVYAIGGELNDETLKSVEIFDGLSWTDGPSFPIPINHHGAAVLRDTLYVIGGETNGEPPLNTIWALHETDKGSGWEKVETKRSTSRTNAAVATFGTHIVIAGGYAGGFLNSVDLFDGEAVTGGPPMPTARSAAKAAVFQNRLYVVGGYKDDKFLNIVEMFDSTSWVSATQMPTARDNFAIGVFDGMLYAIGGANGNDLSTVETFDGKTWKSAPSLSKRINSGAACVYPPEPTSSSTTPLATTTEVSSTSVSATLQVSTMTTSTAATSFASTAYSTTLTETLVTTSTTTTVASPTTSMAVTTPSVTTSSPIEQRALMLNVASREVRSAIFDPDSTSWAVLGTIPVNLENGVGSIEGSATAVAGTALYLIGGQPLENNFLQRTLMLDLTSLTWSRMADMGAPRAFHGAVAVDGGVFALGGYSNMNTVETMERYDLDKNTWSSEGLRSMSQARSHFAVAALGSDIVVAGGYNANNQLLSSVERYSTDSNKWTQLNELPTPRAEGAMTAVAGKLFLSGGVEASESDDERLSQTSSMLCWNCGQDDSDDADDPNGGNDKKDRPQRRQRRSADWQSMQNMSPARKGHSMISSGTSIVIAGGEGGEGGDASDVTKLYDTISNTWTDASLAGGSLSVDDPSSLVLAGISPGLAADAIQAANALSKPATTMLPSTPTQATTSHASTTATIPAESTTDAGGKKDGSTGSDDNTTAIIGAAVACVVILLLIIAVVVYNMRQRTNLKVAASLALEEPEYVTNPTFGAPGLGTGPVYADPNAARTQSAHGYVNMASTQAAVNSMANNAPGSSSTAPIEISSSLVDARKVSPPEANGIPKSVQYYDALRPSGQSTTETNPFATASGTYNSLHDAQVAAALSQPLTVIDYAPPDQIRRAPSQHSTSSEYDSLDASGKRRSAAAIHLSGTYDRLHGESSTDDYSVLDASSKRRSAASLTSQGMYDHMQRPHNPVTGTVVGRHVPIGDDDNEEMEEQSPSAEYAVPVKNSQRNGRSLSRSQVSSAVLAEPPAEEAPSRPQPGVQRQQPRLRAAAAVDNALPIDLPPASVGLMGAAMPSQGKQGGRRPNKNRGGSRA